MGGAAGARGPGRRPRGTPHARKGFRQGLDRVHAAIRAAAGGGDGKAGGIRVHSQEGFPELRTGRRSRSRGAREGSPHRQRTVRPGAGGRPPAASRRSGRPAGRCVAVRELHRARPRVPGMARLHRRGAVVAWTHGLPCIPQADPSGPQREAPAASRAPVGGSREGFAGRRDNPIRQRFHGGAETAGDEEDQHQRPAAPDRLPVRAAGPRSPEAARRAGGRLPSGTGLPVQAHGPHTPPRGRTSGRVRPAPELPSRAPDAGA